MTIAEKSAELGIDLAQIALDNNPLGVCKQDGTHHCFTLKVGENQNIHIKDDNDVKIHDGYFRWSDHELANTSSLAAVETAFKAFIDAQEFIAIDPVVVTYEDIV